MADLTKPRNLDAMLAGRRGRPGLVRDLTDGRALRQGEARIFPSPLRWLLVIGAQLALVAMVVLGILAMPPAIACFDRAQRGFFAGDTFGACAARGL